GMEFSKAAVSAAVVLVNEAETIFYGMNGEALSATNDPQGPADMVVGVDEFKSATETRDRSSQLRVALAVWRGVARADDLQQTGDYPTRADAFKAAVEDYRSAHEMVRGYTAEKDSPNPDQRLVAQRIHRMKAIALPNPRIPAFELAIIVIDEMRG